MNENRIPIEITIHAIYFCFEANFVATTSSKMLLGYLCGCRVCHSIWWIHTRRRGRKSQWRNSIWTRAFVVQFWRVHCVSVHPNLVWSILMSGVISPRPSQSVNQPFWRARASTLEGDKNWCLETVFECMKNDLNSDGFVCVLHKIRADIRAQN